MCTTLPHPGAAAESKAAAPSRQHLGLSCLAGIDVELVLGVSGESATAAGARLAALHDMQSAGVITAQAVTRAHDGIRALNVMLSLADVLDDIEAEEDAGGYEDEPEALAWGWAA